MKKSGYLYVLVHPSDPNLYKIGVTVLHPEKRLAQHNSQLDKHAGQVVKKTGQKWEIKAFIEVRDPYWAERAFWGATHFPDIPYRRGIEVVCMDWQLVQMGLAAATIAGVRPPPVLRPVRDHKWMVEQLDGTEITMIGRYGGLMRGVEFECVNGHVFKDSPGVVANRKSCPCCVVWHWGEKNWGLRSSLR